MKCEKVNIRNAIRKVGYQGWFTSVIEESNVLKIRNIGKNMVNRIHDTLRFTFRGIRMNIEVWHYHHSQITMRNRRRLYIRFYANGRRNDPVNRNIAASDRCLLESPEKGQWIDSVISSGRFRVVVVRCGGHCGGDGVWKD